MCWSDPFAGSGSFTKDFFDYLELWLRSHIMPTDRKDGEHFAQETNQRLTLSAEAPGAGRP